MNPKVITVIIFFFLLSAHSPVDADCAGGLNGDVIRIKVKSCEVLVPGQNSEIQKNAGNHLSSAQLDDLYQGALVTDENGRRWVYHSEAHDPCADFVAGHEVQKRGYTTCCDTGTWGKCAFGGQWLADEDVGPINAFQ